MTATHVDLPFIDSYVDGPGRLLTIEMAERYATAAVLADRAARPDAEPVAAPFIVKHYSADERPIIKGNGFDGLEVGKDRAEAEDFVSWVNAHIAAPPADAKDAARYRWLRRTGGKWTMQDGRKVDLFAEWNDDVMAPDAEMDAAIDAAMLETPTKEAT